MDDSNIKMFSNINIQMNVCNLINLNKFGNHIAYN